MTMTMTLATGRSLGWAQPIWILLRTVLTGIGVGVDVLPLKWREQHKNVTPNARRCQRTDDIASLSQPLPVPPSHESHSINPLVSFCCAELGLCQTCTYKKGNDNLDKHCRSDTCRAEAFTSIPHSSRCSWSYMPQLISIHQDPNRVLSFGQTHKMAHIKPALIFSLFLSLSPTPIHIQTITHTLSHYLA